MIKALINLLKKKYSLNKRLYSDYINSYYSDRDIQKERYWNEKNSDDYIRGTFNPNHYFEYLESKYEAKIYFFY